MPRTRLIGLILILLSAGILAAAIPAFASRAEAFNKAQHFLHLRKFQISDRQFKVFGRDVSITDVAPDDPAATGANAPVPGHSYLRLTYGDQTRLIPIKSPPAQGLPDLLIYGDWLAMLRITEVTAGGDRTDKPDRFLLVIRNTPEGYDPETWGSVRRREWSFDFYELMPDGSITQRAYRFPLPDRPGMSKKAREERVQRLPESIRNLPELEERTLEYEAALHAIPKLQVPNYRFRNTAFNLEVMGWTFPAAAFAVLGVLAGLGLLFAPARTRSA